MTYKMKGRAALGPKAERLEIEGRYW